MKLGPKRAVDGFINALDLFGLGFSWGGYESLAIPCDPQLTRTAADPDLKGPLIRLHIGPEDADDLKSDLDQALKVNGQMAGPDSNLSPTHDPPTTPVRLPGGQDHAAPHGVQDASKVGRGCPQGLDETCRASSSVPSC